MPLDLVILANTATWISSSKRSEATKVGSQMGPRFMQLSQAYLRIPTIKLETCTVQTFHAFLLVKIALTSDALLIFT